MASVLLDVVELLVQRHSLVLELSHTLLLPRWHVADLDLLQAEASELHQLQHHATFDPPVWELPMKQYATVLNTE